MLLLILVSVADPACESRTNGSRKSVSFGSSGSKNRQSPARVSGNSRTTPSPKACLGRHIGSAEEEHLVHNCAV